jgi:predicted aspartyl protease
MPQDGTEIKTYKGVWDTGATGSVLTSKMIEELELKPSGMTEVQTANGRSQSKTYIVDLMLPNNLIIKNLTVSETDSLGAIDLLVGMDVIQMGDFSISNAEGKTRFSFCIPSHEKPICLLEKSNKVNERIKRKSRFASSTA